MLNGLYALTDAALTPDETLFEQVTQALAGGTKIVQLRDKQRSDAQLLELARGLQDLCRQYHALFIINDRIALAKAMAADGVHIGQHDVDFGSARAELPQQIIGVSCYGSLEQARFYEQQGADYVAFGACFASSTKPLAPVIDHQLLALAKQQLSIPICAIGGITLENAPLLVQQGVDMLAVVSDLWTSQDVQLRAQQLSALLIKS